jgi:hypothetical protein
VTSAELRTICDRIGIAPARFAELAGARPGSRPSWIRPDDAGLVPPAVAALARIAEAVGARMAYSELAALLEAEAARLRRP